MPLGQATSDNKSSNPQIICNFKHLLISVSFPGNIFGNIYRIYSISPLKVFKEAFYGNYKSFNTLIIIMLCTHTYTHVCMYIYTNLTNLERILKKKW